MEWIVCSIERDFNGTAISRDADAIEQLCHGRAVFLGDVFSDHDAGVEDFLKHHGLFNRVGSDFEMHLYIGRRCLGAHYQ